MSAANVAIIGADPVAIIGAGPAGLAAAIQLKRYGIDLLLFEAEAVGGLLRNANLVENYPGFPGGIPGMQLVRLFAEQLQEQGVTVTCARVTGVSEDGGLFRIEAGGQVYHAQILVIATGSQALTFQDFAIPEAARAGDVRDPAGDGAGGEALCHRWRRRPGFRLRPQPGPAQRCADPEPQRRDALPAAAAREGCE